MLLPDVAIGEDEPRAPSSIRAARQSGEGCHALASQRRVPGAGAAASGRVAAAAGMTLPPARILNSTPLFHVSGLHSGVVAGLAAGSTTVWQPGRFDPAATLQLIEQERCTTSDGVPTTLWRVVRHPDASSYDTSSLRHVGGGGAAWSPR